MRLAKTTKTNLKLVVLANYNLSKMLDDTVSQGGFMDIQKETEKAMMNTSNVFEFVKGQSDCKQGKPHLSKSESYDQGYAFQYELEQALSHQGVN